MKTAPQRFNSLACLSIVASLGVAACGTTRSYPLPLAAEQAPQATDPLLVCATKMNMQAKKDGSNVVMQVSDASSVVFEASEGGSLVMKVRASSKEDDPATAERLAKAKAAGEAVFKCAQSVPTPASTPAGAPTPTLGNSTAPASGTP